ncbi:MAG: YggS family pyridoxal phosphate-dependent enzyme [Spirochaetaceae bacterium]|jgi:pyridoxal phosphate enzyme (YggS family)|nr:YggS family pyridoxal phosphate-dependent enzyme [Spirochaetaceae bacterium]
MGIQERIDRVRASIAETAVRCGRSPDDVTLCAVSKFHPLSAVEEAFAAGVRVFGESRVQEICAKFQGWERADAQIHLIGPLQRNKVKKAAEFCSCVQSVDRDELVDELDTAAAARGKTLAVLFEINTGEDAKSGYADKSAFFQGVERALSRKNIRVAGLMAMAPFTDDEKTVRTAFRGVYKLREEAASRYPEIHWDTLSMGMSGDFQTAIEEGSTMVRIGTAIFGERQP